MAVAGDIRAFSFKFLTQSIPATNLPAEQTRAKILLLANDSSNPSADELARDALIKSWNFSVTMAGTNTDNTSLTNLIENSAAIYVCSTTDTTAFNFAASADQIQIGVVNEQPEFVDELGFGTEATSAWNNEVNVTNSSHYITTGMSLGNNTLFTSITELYGLSKPASDLAIVGQRTDTVPYLATLSAGKKTYDDRVSAGR